MIDSNALVVMCLEANAFYNAMSEKNRQCSKLAWLDAETWTAKATVKSVIAEVYLMRAQELTK